MRPRRSLHPIEAFRDLFIYAPIGFLVEAPRLIPELVESGRQRLRGAGGVGRLAVQIGQQRLAVRGGRAGAPDAVPPATDAAPPDVDAAPSDVDAPVPEEITIEIVRDDVEPSPREEPLPIPGYDQLAASQVVARLAGLGPADLERVEAYEQDHRRRRTILAKISQLRRD